MEQTNLASADQHDHPKEGGALLIFACQNGMKVDDVCQQTPLMFFGKTQYFGDHPVRILFSPNEGFRRRGYSLFYANTAKSVQFIQVLLETGTDPDYEDENGITALRQIVCWNHVDETLWCRAIRLFEHTNVDAKNSSGTTALMLAARFSNSSAVIKCLVSLRAEVNLQNRYGLSPLIIAARHAPALVEDLLLAGADPNLQSEDGWTALIFGLRARQSTKTIMTLISAKTDVSVQAKGGWTAFMFALRFSYPPEILEALTPTKNGVSLRIGNDSTALMLALRYSHSTEVIKTLISAKGDIHAQNSVGWNVLMMAIRYSRSTSTIRSLFLTERNVATRTNSGWTALMFALRFNGSAEIIKLLIPKSDLSARQDGGWTALMVAANNNRSSRIVQSLISNKAGVNSQNEDGETALMIAARDAPALIENLISNGADVTVRDKTGRTALMYAVERNDQKENLGREVIAALCGSVIDKTTSCGQTALMMSVHCSQTVKYLLELRADPCLVDNQGFNALDAAILGCSSESSLETVQILVGSQVHVPLPTHPFYEMVVRCLLENKQVNGECCACFEVIDSNAVQLRCQHLLHTDCLERWHKNCQQETTCPYCRRLVSFEFSKDENFSNRDREAHALSSQGNADDRCTGDRGIFGQCC